MRIHVYTHTYNECRIMPYFLRHYSSFADHIYVYDAHSDDGTRELVDDCQLATLEDFDCNEINNLEYLNLANSFYKRSIGQAELVIVVDTDEFVYHPAIRDYLSNEFSNGANIFSTTGYQMVSDSFPVGAGQIYDEVIMGSTSDRFAALYGKTCVFAPEIDICYGLGKHSCNPAGPHISYCANSKLKLLHMVHLGPDYAVNRARAAHARLSAWDKSAGTGARLAWPDEEFLAWYNETKQTATVAVP